MNLYDHLRYLAEINETNNEHGPNMGSPKWPQINVKRVWDRQGEPLSCIMMSYGVLATTVEPSSIILNISLLML